MTANGAKNFITTMKSNMPLQIYRNNERFHLDFHSDSHILLKPDPPTHNPHVLLKPDPPTHEIKDCIARTLNVDNNSKVIILKLRDKQDNLYVTYHYYDNRNVIIRKSEVILVARNVTQYGNNFHVTIGPKPWSTAKDNKLFHWTNNPWTITEVKAINEVEIPIQKVIEVDRSLVIFAETGDLYITLTSNNLSPEHFDDIENGVCEDSDYFEKTSLKSSSLTPDSETTSLKSSSSLTPDHSETTSLKSSSSLTPDPETTSLKLKRYRATQLRDVVSNGIDLVAINKNGDLEIIHLDNGTVSVINGRRPQCEIRSDNSTIVTIDQDGFVNLVRGDTLHVIEEWGPGFSFQYRRLRCRY